MISRRGVLLGAGAVAALASARTMFAAADEPDDRARLLANVSAFFAGTAATNAHPAMAGKLAVLDQTARTRLTAMDAAAAGQLFAGLADLATNDANLASSFSYLYDIALATAAPRPTTGPAGLYGDTAIQDRVLDGLQWLYDRYYGNQSSGYYGNWFNWEIGISRSVTLTLAVLRERVEQTRPDLITSYLTAMDGYLRNGKDGDVDLDSRFHTGANLADITTNRIIQGALTGDDARITKAVSDQLTVYATVDPYRPQHGVKDGYYADGSFIQHESVAYTGSYGRTLLSRVTQTIDVLSGTRFAGSDDLIPTVRGWIENGFAPLIFEGWMMEIVKGRAVSRTGTGYADVGTVIEAVTALSGHLTGADAAALRGYAKQLGTSTRPATQPSALISPAAIVRYADLLNDPATVAADLGPGTRTVAFNAMDRHVHRRPGYAFALSRSSERISKYEYMNGENLMPWFQGEGAHYLYLAGQDQRSAYGIDYFTCVSPDRLAGVTAPVEERRTIPQLYGRNWYENPDHPLNFTSSSESQNAYVYFPVGTNAWSGGAVLGRYAMVGMIRSDDVAFRDKQAGLLPEDFVAYQNSRSRSSWLMLDEQIVVLTAGITDPAGRDVVTTFDSRIAAPGDSTTITGELRDGTRWPGSARTTGLSWLHYANQSAGASVGYLPLDDSVITIDERLVTNSRRMVRVSNPDTKITKRVFTIGTVHPADTTTTGSHAYALVPNATVDDLRRYRETEPVLEVLANSSAVQAVRHLGLGLTAINTFTDGPHRIGWIQVDGPASVIITRHGHDLDIAVSDPTFGRDSITVGLELPHLQAAAADGITVHQLKGGTEVIADTHHAYGRSRTVRLRR